MEWIWIEATALVMAERLGGTREQWMTYLENRLVEEAREHATGVHPLRAA